MILVMTEGPAVHREVQVEPMETIRELGFVS